jgi:hypothetical protein
LHQGIFIQAKRTGLRAVQVGPAQKVNAVGTADIAADASIGRAIALAVFPLIAGADFCVVRAEGAVLSTLQVGPTHVVNAVGLAPAVAAGRPEGTTIGLFVLPQLADADDTFVGAK